MGRTNVRKRITPRPKPSKPAKSIEQAFEQISKLVPMGVRAHVSGYWTHLRDSCYSYSNENYYCTLHVGGKEIAELKSTSPAKLVAAFREWAAQPFQHDDRPKPVARPFSAEIDLSTRSLAVPSAPVESRSSSGNLGHAVPRLNHQLPLLTHNGV